jgi:hypothetical protein
MLDSSPLLLQIVWLPDCLGKALSTFIHNLNNTDLCKQCRWWKQWQMHLSLSKNEMVDGQIQCLVNVDDGMQQCGQCEWHDAKVGGECGIAIFVW